MFELSENEKALLDKVCALLENNQKRTLAGCYINARSNTFEVEFIDAGYFYRTITSMSRRVYKPSTGALKTMFKRFRYGIPKEKVVSDWIAKQDSKHIY